MWGIISIALMILLFFEKTMELKMCFLIAAALFAIANEVNTIAFRMKKNEETKKKESKDAN